MTKSDIIAGAIAASRITDMRAWIAPRLPTMTRIELYDAWIDAIERNASFAGDPPWLDLVEAEYARRGLQPGAAIAAND